MTSPTRVRVSPSQIAPEHQGRDQQHEGAVRRELRAVDAEQREVEQFRHPVGHRQKPPGHLHGLLDDECDAEGEEQFCDVAAVMHPPQAPHLDGRTDKPAQHVGARR